MPPTSWTGCSTVEGGAFNRPGTPRKIGDDAIAETIRLTLETTPADATHWSLRAMARQMGYAPSPIHRIWRAFGLQPHRVETFKLSTDPVGGGASNRRPSAGFGRQPLQGPSSAARSMVRDIVGLYLTPPDRALVLCVDEKSHVWMAPGQQGAG